MDSAYARNKLILITAFITMFITSLVWIGIGAMGYWMVTREAPPFAVSIVHPDVVEVGQTLTLEVTVTNEDTKDLKLAEVDFEETLLNGFEVVSLSPKPRTQERIYGIASYGFSRKLKPAESCEIELKLRAKEVGLWAGGIDIYTPTLNCLSEYAEIEIVDAPVAPKIEK